MEINFENHYERITVQIESLLSFNDPFPGISESSLETYSVRFFSEDWLKNKGYDWGEYLSTLLDKTTDCISNFEEFISENKEFEDPFFEFSLDENDENANLIDKYNLVSRFIPQLKDFRKEIVVCSTFFEDNKDLPPYNIKLEKENRIPFWGNSREFTIFFNLIVNASLILAKKQNREELYLPEEIKFRTNLDNYYSLPQVKLAELLCQYFYGVNIDKGTIQEINFSPNTIAKKFSNSQNTEAGTIRLKRFSKKIDIFLKEFESIISNKETEKQIHLRSGKEKTMPEK